MKKWKKVFKAFTVIFYMTLLCTIIHPASEVHAASVKNVKLLSFKASSSGKITIKWKRETGVSGYQIQYSEKSTFPKNKTLTKTGITNDNRTTSVTVIGNAGKTYYARVRGYKWSGKKQVFGSWSSKKSATIKPKDLTAKSYNELVNAIKKVKNGQTIKVTKAITTKKRLVINRPGISFTIDFGGNKYKSTPGYDPLNDYAVNIKAGNVTLKSGNMRTRGTTLIWVDKKGKLSIVSGTYIVEGNYDEEGYAIINKGTLNIKNGSFKGPFMSVIDNFSNCTIENGTFTSASGMSSLFTDSGSSTTVKGGKFRGDFDASGKVYLKGGNFKKIILYNAKYKISDHVTYTDISFVGGSEIK